jgi:hypothetical protein
MENSLCGDDSWQTSAIGLRWRRGALQAPALFKSCITAAACRANANNQGSHPMHGPRNFLTREDRQSIRRWRWGYIGICGSLLAGLIAHIAFSPHRDANYAAAPAPVSVNR